jgi:hypothetical protein
VRFSEKVVVQGIEVLDNSDYFECILCLTREMTCMPLNLIIAYFHSFCILSCCVYNIANRNFVIILHPSPNIYRFNFLYQL